MLFRAESTCSTEALGAFDLSTAQAPATWGTAREVPERRGEVVFRIRGCDPPARRQQIQLRGTVGEAGDLVPGRLSAVATGTAIVGRPHAHDAGDAGRGTDARCGFLVSRGSDGGDSDGPQIVDGSFRRRIRTVAFTSEKTPSEPKLMLTAAMSKSVAELEDPLQARNTDLQRD